MACMTPVSEGARIDIKAPQAETFRSAVIEWLMENHPHDCPVCEEGGECHLQDMTVMTGHTARRYRGAKRTWDNQYLGPFVGHEMNRCITCYRCVRFYRDYAGGNDLAAFGSRGRMYFGRSEPGVLDNEFSGNLVEVCPTGVFTDKPFSAAYTRKWDLQSAPSVCTGCAVGCNIFASERYGVLKRVHNRYHADINRYFICDRGRFGMTHVNSASRIRLTGRRTGDGLFQQIMPAEALEDAARICAMEHTLAVGSPRASLEDNQALRQLVGADNFSAGMSSAEERFMRQALAQEAPPTLTEVETADAVLVLGEDLLNTAPRLALALRQAVRNRAYDMAADADIPLWQDAGVRGHAQHAANPVFIASVLPTRLDDIATNVFHAEPQTLAACGDAIASALRDADGADTAALDGALAEFVARAAAALAQANRPLIVTGASHMDPALLAAARSVCRALEAVAEPRLVVCGSEANSFGVSRFSGGLTLDEVLDSIEAGATRNLVVMGNDLHRRADRERVEAALARLEHLIVIDGLDNPTANAAELVFPAATSAECTGTLVNYESRAQRFYQVFVPTDDIRPAWRWCVEIASGMGRNDMAWQHVDDVLDALAAQPEFNGIAAAAPPASTRSGAGQKVPRAPHRYSGRTAMYADRTMHEPKAAVDDDTPLSFSMEGLNRDEPGALVPYVWAPGWNSNQSLFKFQQEVGGSLQGGDPGLRLGVLGGDAAAQAAIDSPEAAAAAGMKLLHLPQLFGSEELSAYAPAMEARMQPPWIVLHPGDAARLGVEAGDGVACAGHSLEVRIDEVMAPGFAAVTVGMPGAPGWLPDDFVSLSRDPDFVRRPTIIARG
jgi:NADH-quinone oxidoreductase subunit G